MANPRLDPATPGSPVLGAVVTTAVLTRVLRLAAERGVSKSVVTRELLELGLRAHDAGWPPAILRGGWKPPGGAGPHTGKTKPVAARIPLDQIPQITRLAGLARPNPSEFIRRAVADAIDTAELADAG